MKHRLAVMVAVTPADGSEKYLAVREGEGPAMGLPAGLVLDKELPVHAVRRIVEELLGVRVDPTERVGLSHRWSKSQDSSENFVTCLVIKARLLDKLPEPSEGSVDWKWMTWDSGLLCIQGMGSTFGIPQNA